MLVVRVELWSAITHERSEIARMTICNTGLSSCPSRGDYTVAALRGRSAEDLDKGLLAYHRDGHGPAATRAGAVRNHARRAEHVWNLVAKALRAVNYGDAR